MLEGKTILITGAGGALGAIAADVACDEGAKLILVDREVGEASHEAHWITVDLTDRQATMTALSDLAVDAVLHIAGGFVCGTPSHEVSDAEWNEMFQMNVTTLRNVTHAVVPTMLARGKGSIVTVGALSATTGKAGMAAYCAAKSTVMRFTESLAAELKDSGITVNSVAPSILDTPAGRASMPDADHSRWVSRKSLAQTMCFLCSDAARDITGAIIPIAGRV